VSGKYTGALSRAIRTLPVIASAWGLSAVFHVAAGAATVGAAGIALLYSPAPLAAMRTSSVRLGGLSRRETGLVGVASVPWMLYNLYVAFRAMSSPREGPIAGADRARRS